MNDMHGNEMENGGVGASLTGRDTCTRRMWWLLIATTVVVALVVTLGWDAWRIPFYYQGKSCNQWFFERSLWFERGHQIPFDFAPHDDPNSLAFRAMGSNAVPLLIRKLKPPKPVQSWQLPYANALVKLPRGLATLMPYPTALLDEQLTAIEVAGIIGPQASNTVPSLISILEDRHTTRNTAKAVVRALGRIGPASKAAVPVLCKLLEVETPRDLISAQVGSYPFRGDVRPQILKTLGRIGPDAKAAVPLLIQELKEYPRYVAECREWQRLHEGGSFDINYIYQNKNIQAELREKREILAGIAKKNLSYAAWSLWQIDHSQSGKVVPVFIMLLEGDEYWEPAVACDNMNRTGVATITSIGFEGRALVAEHLGEIGDPEAIAALNQSIKSGDPILSAAAQKALAQITTTQ